jgi:PKD repeat protein
MLNGTASDDGIGNPMSTLTYTWSKVSGPGTVSFSSSSILNPTATFSAVGTYELRLTVNDGWASSSDTVIIRNNLVPIANAGSPQSTKKSRDYILVGAIGYDPDNLPGPLTITWSGTGIKSGGSTLSPTVYFDNTGTYTLTLTVNDGLELRTSQVVITVTP